jgi:hypothetical protein
MHGEHVEPQRKTKTGTIGFRSSNFTGQEVSFSGFSQINCKRKLSLAWARQKIKPLAENPY